MKIDSRLFAMKFLEMRLYFCMTEANITKHIMPYFPQQTMPLSENDLAHRLLFLTKEAEEICPLIPAFINLDFVKWNLQWRMETTCMIFQYIDQMFRTPGLLLHTHEFFENLNVFLSHRLRIPP